MSSKFKPPRPSVRRSSLMMTVLLIPVIILFFLFGAYVGSQFMEEDIAGTFPDTLAVSDVSVEITKGLPGTNNVLRRWSSDTPMKYLRGAAAEMRDVARMAEALVGMKPPAPLTHIMMKNMVGNMGNMGNGSITEISENDPVHDVGIHEHLVEDELKGLKRPMMPNSMYNHAPVQQHIFSDASIPEGHTVSGTQQKDELKKSFHATKQSFMVGPNSLDNSNILVGAWVYLDDSSVNDNDMRTIFTNKKSGCENQKDQYGLSMYVNAWETNNHRLYVEYGGLESGCHKLDSNGVQLHPEQWYHVAVYLGDTSAYLFIDGTVVSTSSGGTAVHQIQSNRPLRVGQYDQATFPLFGNISHLAFIHCEADWSSTTVEVAVKSMMDIKLVKSIKGLHALYTFNDAVAEIHSSIALDSAHALNGVYSFPIPGKSHPGVSIDLIDGVGGRLITAEMKLESDRIGRIRRESVKEGMKHAWKVNS